MAILNSSLKREKRRVPVRVWKYSTLLCSSSLLLFYSSVDSLSGEGTPSVLHWHRISQVCLSGERWSPPPYYTTQRCKAQLWYQAPGTRHHAGWAQWTRPVILLKHAGRVPLYLSPPGPGRAEPAAFIGCV